MDSVRAMIGRGDKTMAFAAIAREARVSVPTIYRHFPTRPELFEAIYLDAERHAGPRADDLRALIDPVARRRMLRRFYARFDDPGDLYLRASRLNAVWEFSRAATVPRRRALMAAWVDERVPTLSEPQRTWLIDLAVVMVSSATAEMMRGYLDRTGAETADRVEFALQALLAHAEALAGPTMRVVHATPVARKATKPVTTRSKTANAASAKLGGVPTNSAKGIRRRP